jgi:glycosyltransferase involved in cell wall biosynthesis
MQFTEKISVVIATLGGTPLKATLQALMNGTVRPDEILICIPEKNAAAVETFQDDIVRVVITPQQGQVKQRAFGFRSVTGDLVLQLDDDICLNRSALQVMCESLQGMGKGNAVAPVYYADKTGTCIHQLEKGWKGAVKNLFDCFFCAAEWGTDKMGKVTSIGINYGVDDALMKNSTFPVQWLPGGCVLSYRADLITEDFFPFEGKAYCEDIFHSFYRRRAGISQWVLKDVIVHTEMPVPDFRRSVVEKQIRIRRCYVSITGGVVWRLIPYEWFCRFRSRKSGQ